MANISDSQRKAIFAMMEAKKKAKEAQIATTMKLKDWEMLE